MSPNFTLYILFFTLTLLSRRQGKVAIPADRHVTQKEAEKKLKYKSLYTERERDTTNVKHEMYDYTCNNWNHRNSNKRFKEECGNHTRKTCNRFSTKDSYALNITNNTESIAV